MTYNIPDFVSRSEMNKIPISDFLAAMKFPFYEQVQSLRHYREELCDTGFMAEFTVNMARNEWISRKDGVHGQLTDLIGYLHAKPDGYDGNYREYMKLTLDAFQELETLPGSFPATTVRLGRLHTALTERIDSSVYALMTRQGISKRVIDRYCKQVEVKDGRKSKERSLLAFPADNDNWYLFRGSSWMPYDESDITTIGEFRKNQSCFVYDSPSDFLAMMEMWHRNRVTLSFGSTYHLIINGRQNIRKAQQFIRDNPDFLSVKTFFPNTADGRQLFKDINDACKGTAVNRSDIFKGQDSLAAQMRMHVPSDIYEKYAVKRSGREEALSSLLAEGSCQATEKFSQTQCPTKLTSENKEQKTKLPDKDVRGTGPFQEVTLEPQRKGWKL